MAFSFSGKLAPWLQIGEACSKIFTEDINFSITKDGVRFRAMSANHVVVVEGNWRRDSFSKFECSKDTKVAVNFPNLLKLLGRGKPDDKLRMAMEGKEGLQISIFGKYRKNWSLPIASGGPAERIETPKVPVTVESEFVSDSFRSITEDIAAVSDHLTISVRDHQFLFKGKSALGRGWVPFTKKDGLVRLLAKESIEGQSYNIEYLLNFLQPIKTIDRTVVKIAKKTKEGAPLCIQLRPEQHVVFTLYLAMHRMDKGKKGKKGRKEVKVKAE
jgi:proliferating cell antigen-like protein